MQSKRITIYDLAKALDLSVSCVSKALNKKPGVSDKVRATVFEKAKELNYKHNTQAANLRKGSTRTIGVIVPHINQTIFSDAISGIEKACTEQGFSLVICQSHDSFEIEKQAVETLIHQNVDAILISVSEETKEIAHLQQAVDYGLHIIQFDRCLSELLGYKVENNNEMISYQAVQSLLKEGYRKIAFLGGPLTIPIYQQRFNGYQKALTEAGLEINSEHTLFLHLNPAEAYNGAKQLLSSANAPDAFFCIADYQALAVLNVCKELALNVPHEIGIIGFANETFSALIEPPLSTIDQKAEEMGYQSARVYFDHILHKTDTNQALNKTTACELLIRKSSIRKGN